MAEAASIRVFVAPALTIRPGDRVLLNVGGGEFSPEDWERIIVQLRELFPDVEFTALFGVDQVAVQPAELEDPHAGDEIEYSEDLLKQAVAPVEPARGDER